MKKLLLLLFVLFGITANAQLRNLSVVADTVQLKLTEGKVALLLAYGYGSDEGGGLFRRMDSTYTEDGVDAFDYPNEDLQWVRINLLTSGQSYGTNVFTTTAATDSVYLPGASSTDVYLISPNYVAGVDQQDVLEWKALTDTLVVIRMASGESALKYSWLRIKK